MGEPGLMGGDKSQAGIPGMEFCVGGDDADFNSLGAQLPGFFENMFYQRFPDATAAVFRQNGESFEIANFRLRVLQRHTASRSLVGFKNEIESPFG